MTQSLLDALARAAGRDRRRADQREPHQRRLHRRHALAAPGGADPHAGARRLPGAHPAGLGRRHDRHHHPAGPRGAAGRAAGGQLAHADRRPRRLPAPVELSKDFERRRAARRDAAPGGPPGGGRACPTARRGSETPILSGVAFSLAPGEALAIIGPSAAGKSTLARLLTGVWAPTTGTVRLDGAEVAHWPREELGPWIGYVPQDVELFDGSVADNIARLGKVDSEAVVAAAKRANAHELILTPAAGLRHAGRRAGRAPVARPAPARRARARPVRRPAAGGAGRAELQPGRRGRGRARAGAERAAQGGRDLDRRHAPAVADRPRRQDPGARRRAASSSTGRPAQVMKAMQQQAQAMVGEGG